MRYHFYMMPPLSIPFTILLPPPMHTHKASYKWVKEKCVYLKMYDACVFLFPLHFLWYPRFSYRRYKTEKYISRQHSKFIFTTNIINSKFLRLPYKKIIQPYEELGSECIYKKYMYI